ncbi:MAG: choice-of-anchor J domain-containing protein [bacterium]
MKRTTLQLWIFVSILSILMSAGYAQNRKNVSSATLQVLDQKTDRNPEHSDENELALETFNTFLPDGWQKVTLAGGIGWQQGAVDSQVVGFDRGVFDAPPGGGQFIAYTSWVTGDSDGNFGTTQSTDQWLITPRILNVQDGDSLRFYLRYFDSFNDNLDVLISTRGDSIADFDTLVTLVRFTGPGNNEWRPYSFSLTDFVSAGDSIFIAFREHVSNTGAEGDALFLDLVEVASFVTSVANPSTGPATFELHQNFPNPFNPSTTIAFSLLKSSQVSLRIYNVLGQLVSTVLEEKLYPQGSHKVVFDAKELPNGIYYYKLEADAVVVVKKMILLK